MSEYLLQTKAEFGVIQAPFIVNEENGEVVEDKAIDFFFEQAAAQGRVFGVGVMQVLKDNSHVFGTYFNHYGKTCISYISRAEYFARQIINTGNIVLGDVMTGAIPLESYADLGSVLSRCQSGNLVIYSQQKFGKSLFDALMTINDTGELVPVETMEIF